ncbi:hypothetical protein SAICODRAFT_7462 [Saitoella complicata NRRL Y-17804]|uniref:Survival motor neuron Tudor domain-containing protein n=1 Tax=Saitoella complicata (strain BCRC 22490 / CBS 7301 / JCM 7358 / NBRC 10748 / NRRL Y-17804) TaxID=698492 RepID=A0A0E9NGJ2_SAICN|nr:uncharacterized protein SAICODRAFT_7462 [Saitoella complicata NRRL Y-17804]ODQ52852.1 hypothetical protein SAICODRAFT_7462 [Saitoella complicata NRRL Y-17804]GAO48525.1 hypothetical protein G7K_2698-t1 [Saitoella complicata NRRL Y-17804]
MPTIGWNDSTFVNAWNSHVDTYKAHHPGQFSDKEYRRLETPPPRPVEEIEQVKPEKMIDDTMNASEPQTTGYFPEELRSVDPELREKLMAWYTAGYQAGYYAGQQAAFAEEPAASNADCNATEAAR